jgi:Lantibiotic dehydratase, N terminus
MMRGETFSLKMKAREKSMVTYQEMSAASATDEQQQGQLLAPYFLMRVTGLPFSTVNQLHFPQTDRLIEELLQIERWQQEHSPELHNTLREQIKQIIDKDMQHKGLDLRRAVNSNNGLRAQKLLGSLASVLPQALVAETEMWCQQSIRQTTLLQSGEVTLQQELSTNRRTLHQLFRNDDFQHGLLLSSETLYKELQHYLSMPLEKNNNRVRRTEEGLLSYLIRMATKTSPYSTFCTTAMGTWQEKHTPPASAAETLHVHDWHSRRIVRLSEPLFRLLVQTLTHHPEVRPHSYILLNSTLHWLVEQNAEEKQWGKIEVLEQEKIQGRRFDYNERLLRIQLNMITSTIVKTLEHSHTTWTYQQLLASITESMLHRIVPADERVEQTPAWSNAQQQIIKKVTTALEQLITHAVIALDLRIPAHEDDKMQCLLQRLEAFPGPWSQKTRFALEELYTSMSAYADATPMQCAEILQTIRDQCIALCQRVGSFRTPAWDPTSVINQFYPSLILEDAILPDAQLTLTRQRWEPVLADLRVLHSLAPLFDFGMIAKIYMDRWASRTCQQDEDFIRCHLRFWQDFKANQQVRQEELQKDPHLLALRRLQESFIAHLTGVIQQAQHENCHSVQLDVAEIQRLTQHFPAFIKQPATLAHFGQLFFDQREPHMLLNATWAGPGVAFSRFSYPFSTPEYGSGAKCDPLATQMQAYAAQVGQKQNVTYASIAETGDINVNTHTQIMPYEILFPFSVAQQDEEHQLSLRDLRATFDTTEQEFRIFSQRLQTPIAPLHLGFSLIQMMPPLYQSLVTTTEHYPKFDMVTVLEARLTPEQKRGIRHYPRIALGHVIINRECWKVPVTAIPQREAGETMFDYCLKMNRWRSNEALPEICFRRILLESETPFDNSATPSAVEEDQQASDEEKKNAEVHHRTSSQIHKTLRKPFYLDFHNSFHLSLFNTALKAFAPETTLTFEEVLPTPEQHLLTRDGQSYATECIIELGS